MSCEPISIDNLLNIDELEENPYAIITFMQRFYRQMIQYGGRQYLNELPARRVVLGVTYKMSERLDNIDNIEYRQYMWDEKPEVLNVLMHGCFCVSRSVSHEDYEKIFVSNIYFQIIDLNDF